MTTPITLRNTPAKQEVRSQVTIRFAGDSGDGMQLTGMQFTKTSALAGNDLATFPTFLQKSVPLREPSLVYRVFQVQFGSQEIFTPGDEPDVLVAMNPAALRPPCVVTRGHRDSQRGHVRKTSDGKSRLRNV